MKLKTAIEYWDYIYQGIDLPNGMYVEMNDIYIQFLKRTLQLWMFIPCDKEGKPLEKPEHYFNKLEALPLISQNDKEMKEQAKRNKYLIEYQQACDRCLFEGFEIKDKVNDMDEFRLLIQDKDSFGQVFYKTGNGWKPMEYQTINDLSGKVDLVEKVAEKYKYDLNELQL